VVGGSAFVVPWNRGVAYLSLAPVDAEVTVRSLHAVNGGRATGWEARIHVQAKIPAESNTLLSAAENLLGKNEEEVRLVIRHIVEGAVPAVLARLRPAEGEPDWDRLAAEIESSVAPDLITTGLVIRTLSITALHGITPVDGAAPPPANRPSESLPALTAPPPRVLSSADVELRMARVERGLGIMGAELVRIVRDGRDSSSGRGSSSVFDSALGYEGPFEALVPETGADLGHDSMGDGLSPRPRRSLNEGPGEGGLDPSPLSDSEPSR
ncbi:MAG: hypothetical protein ACREDE_08430, partial [Thermoplasmata archaeon]